MAVLFTTIWRSTSDERNRIIRERQGVEYLTRLAPLVTILAESQSSALAGVGTPPAALAGAVADIAEVDNRLGTALDTRSRWTGLQDRIGKLPTATGDRVTLFRAHVEVTDLLLALYAATRDKSGLARDPDNDVSHLQQAIAIELPEAVTQSTRMADLSVLAPSAPPDQRAQLGREFAAAVSTTDDAVEEMTESLEAAVDETDSRTLSGNLISPLDSFRRGIEALTRGANPAGKPNAATLATARSQLTQTTAGLNGIVLRETDALLQQRLDAVDRGRLQALLTLVAAVLIALLALGVPALGRRRPRHDNAEGRTTTSRPDASGGDPRDPPFQAGHDIPANRREQFGALR